MREIKFRVWTGTKYETDVIVGIFGVFYVNPYNNGLDEDDKASLTRFNTKLENIIIEQFTGLHDKNGKEIYEGDIVRIGTYHDDDEGEPGWWMDDSVHKVAWQGSHDYPAFDLEPSIDTDCNGLAYIAVGEQQAEVIGNIHDNPELLA